MTKHRPPLTFDAALARVVGQLPGDYAEAARICGRAESTVRNWSNPDRSEDVPIRCAVILDIAFQASGGIGAPFYEAFTHQLGLAATDTFSLPAQLLHLAPDVIRENSEVEIALVNAARPDATEQDRLLVAKEADDVIARMRQVKTAVLPPRPDQHHQTGPPGAA
jgi:hypothetical protein